MKSPQRLARLHIQTVALKAIHDALAERSVTQLLPVMLSTVTDPLCHDVSDAAIVYEGQELQLTKSMLLQKQAAFLVDGLERLYVVSPNVRLETPECKESGRHLIEFSQVDIELRDTSREEFMELMEGVVQYVLQRVSEACADELALLGRRLHVPSTPFRAYESKQLRSEHGEEYERVLSEKAKEPFWILDLEREFYDREEPRGYYRNYDLIWPEGYGEALSGGERDWEYDVLIRKLADRKQREADFAPYMELAKQGLLVPTAGGGLGVERLVRFLTGAEHIREATLFPRVPGERVVV